MGGESSRKAVRKALFLESHPTCCYCGGGALASTIDHAPPRTFFVGRQAPEGYVFPSCAPCNAGMARLEQVAALYVRAFSSDRNAPAGEARALLRGVMNNAPQHIPNLQLPPSVKRAALRDWGIEVPRGVFLEDVPAIGLPPDTYKVIEAVGRRLGYALRYRHLGVPAPSGSRSAAMWTQLQHPAAQDFIDLGLKFLPSLEVGGRSNTELGDQFVYRWGFNEEESLFGAMIQMGSLLILTAIESAGAAPLAESQFEWRPLADELWRGGSLENLPRQTPSTGAVS